MIARRGFLRGSMLAGSVGALATQGSQAEPWSRDAPSVDVRAFGAAGDGMADDTSAFNRATEAGAAWSPALARAIRVPPGRYRIDGTVRLRKGQQLIGEGVATLIDARRATGATFVLGAGARGGDPGGAPVALRSLQTLGGAGSAAVIETAAQGFAIADLFLSAPGIGLLLTGADGIVSNVAIDQGLNGIVLRRAQNIVMSGLNLFHIGYALTLDTECRDIAVGTSIFSYARRTSILFPDGATAIRAISFTGCHFTSNAQDEGFEGHVHCRAGAVDALFSGCTFRNWRGQAIRQTAGADVDFGFTGCVFDGAPAAAVYNGSLDAGVIESGARSSFSFTGCSFRNLRGPIARTRPELRKLLFTGGGVAECAAPHIAGSGWSAALAVRGLDGFGAGPPGSRTLALPLDAARGRWRVRLESDRGASETIVGAADRGVSVRPIWADPGIAPLDARRVGPAVIVAIPAGARASVETF